jgi:hypothetical protein
MREFRIPKQKCPRCGYKLDATTSTSGDQKPEPGDLSLCFECGQISVFTENDGMRVPTKDEELELSVDPRVIRAQIFMRGIKRPNPKNKGESR